MAATFTEETLRAWFRANASPEFRACEAEFISVMREAAEPVPVGVGGRTIPPEDWLFDTVPAAQVTIGNRNIRLEELTLDLVKIVLCSGGAELLVGKPVPVATVVVSACLFARDAGKYVSQLSSGELDFYRFLVTNFYSFSDRLNELLYPPAGAGFSLDEAVGQYVSARLEKDPSAGPDGPREAAKEAVRLLREKNILRETKNGSWRISF